MRNMKIGLAALFSGVGVMLVVIYLAVWHRNMVIENGGFGLSIALFALWAILTFRELYKAS
jgi:hypothetical protein